MYVFTEAEIVEALHDDVELKAISPGGRPADDSSLDRSPKQNWVEQRGGLPRYVRMVANALVRTGKSRSTAIAIAISKMKRWAAGGDNVRPQVQAAAAKALAQWEAMKGSKSAEAVMVETWDEKSAQAMLEQVLDEDRIEQEEKTLNAFEEQFALESKSASRNAPGDMEHKSVGVAGVQVEDEGNGIVKAYVSVTNMVDGVNDVIHDGAYEKSLRKRKPKGIWSHDWNIPVSRTLEAKALKPGDPDLPKTLPDGRKWPANAGALFIKTEFNLETQRGREAYSDVVFFGEDQEWSIGYRVPPGGAKIDTKTGQRHIHVLDLYEYSPVLFGAMPIARTKVEAKGLLDEAGIDTSAMTEVKSMIFTDRALTMTHDDFMEWKTALLAGEETDDARFEVKDARSAVEESDDAPQALYDADDEDYVASLFEDEDWGIKASPAAAGGDDDWDDEPEDGASGDPEERDGTEREDEETPGTLSAVVTAQDLGEDFEALVDLAEDFDMGVEDDDAAFRDETADEILSIIEDNLDDVDDDQRAAFQNIAKAILEAIPDSESAQAVDDAVEQRVRPRRGKRDEGAVEEKSISMGIDKFQALREEIYAEMRR